MRLYEKSDRLMETGKWFKNKGRLRSQMTRGNIMRRTFLLFVAFCISAASTFAQGVKPDVYVAGYEGGYTDNIATLWKNGVAQYLTDKSYAYSVFVSGNDVYVAGVRGYSPILWKNGVAQSLSNYGEAWSVFVSGNDVYVAGYETLPGIADFPTLWKNGVAQRLSNSGRAYSVFVSSNDVYVVGEEEYNSTSHVATLWKNGIPQRLLTDGYYYSSAYSVFVSGNDVYVAGDEGCVVTLWKNGTAQHLTGYDDGGATSVFVSGNDVYMTGTTIGGSVATLWKNGTPQRLPTDSYKYTYASSVFVSGNDVYVAGYGTTMGGDQFPMLWINNVPHRLSDKAGYANSVFINENVSTPKLTVSPTAYNFTASGGTSSTITVTSNQSWTVSSNASWLKTSRTSGSNNDTFTMTATANTSASSRSATITVSGGGITKTISVTQDGNVPSASLTVSPETYNFVASGGTSSTITVTSNQSWTVSSNTSWLTTSRTSGNNNDIFTMTATANTSTSSRSATVTVSGGGITRTINVTQDGNILSDDFVVINGVSWATRNVDKPGAFAAKPEDAGMFYQWNRKVGWSSTEPRINSNGGTIWDSSTPTGTTWEKINDPSPAGWRVPTLDEFQKLLDVNRVSNEWTTVNGITGRKFIDRSSGNSIFLPALGCRNNSSDGSIHGIGAGDYWSSTQFDSKNAHHLYIYSDDAFCSDLQRIYGFCIRSVKESITGIDDVLANQLLIFPNPTTNDLFIKSDLSIKKVEIYSLTGSLLISENNFTEKISLSALPKGVYLLKVYNDKGMTVSKFVKE